MTDPSSRLGEIKARQEAAMSLLAESGYTGRAPGSVAALTDLAADSGWLLEHVEQLRAELTEADAVVSDVTEQLTGRALMVADLARLREQRQALLDVCAERTAHGRPFIDLATVRHLLGADDDW